MSLAAIVNTEAKMLTTQGDLYKVGVEVPFEFAEGATFQELWDKALQVADEEGITYPMSLFTDWAYLDDAIHCGGECGQPIPCTLKEDNWQTKFERYRNAESPPRVFLVERDKYRSMCE
ncbi:TPA: hypothetical protein HA239_00105 [Candidatus Woesearchaeota archaeon]|nr:hypothetical protein QT06_C0001G0385 [archaeon GW2011_AR15]MBS3103698.1 hypothetical protein [Candidatus Woesearchaeota archaeon]HIH40801.1 hypothetical protein [Candidatus Woesearchaeota archaeon]